MGSDADVAWALLGDLDSMIAGYSGSGVVAPQPQAPAEAVAPQPQAPAEVVAELSAAAEPERAETQVAKDEVVTLTDDAEDLEIGLRECLAKEDRLTQDALELTANVQELRREADERLDLVMGHEAKQVGIDWSVQEARSEVDAELSAGAEPERAENAEVGRKRAPLFGGVSAGGSKIGCVSRARARAGPGPGTGRGRAGRARASSPPPWILPARAGGFFSLRNGYNSL